MLWVKALHIVSMVAWFAGLFYLPRLFVYHAMTADALGRERFRVMERKLYRAIMTPAAIATVVFGLWLWLGYGINGRWLHIKLLFVLILIGYHLYCGKLVRDFAAERERHGHVFFRWFNELPALILLAVVILVVVKPF